MARLVLLVALCVLPALVSAAGRPTKDEKGLYMVEGRVYCDTCKAGYETYASTYIKDAVVRVECKDRDSMKVVYSQEAKTDKDGCYRIPVHEDHKDQMCDALLVKSSQSDCAKLSAGRERARVVLTSYNGIASERRFANNMGFEKEVADAGCDRVLAQYQEVDEEV